MQPRYFGFAILVVLAFALGTSLSMSAAFAQNETNETTSETNVSGPFTLAAQQISALAATAGVTPDSALYFLDSSFDRLSLWAASWGGPQAFVDTSLKIMNETKAETILMALQNNTVAMATAQDRFETVKNETLNAVEQVKNETTRAEILSNIGTIAGEKVSLLSVVLQNVSEAAKPRVLEAVATANATLQDVSTRLGDLLPQLPPKLPPIRFCLPSPVIERIIDIHLALGGSCQTLEDGCPFGPTVECSLRVATTSTNETNETTTA